MNTQSKARSVDVTGLPEEAIRAVEHIVSVFRGQKTPHLGGTAAFASRDEWVKAINEWADSHKTQGTAADWGRDSIYAGRGE